MTNAFAPFIGPPGLQIVVNTGTVIINGAVTTVPTTNVQLVPNNKNYVYLDYSTGNILSNTTGFPTGVYTVAVVNTLLASISTLLDERPDISSASSAAPSYGSSTLITWNNDLGLSRIGPLELAIGSNILGDFTGSLLLTNQAIGLYSGGGQGHMGQINGITFAGDFPPPVPYGSAALDIGIYVTSTPLGSAMGVNSAVAIQGNTHNCFALNGQIASPSGYSGNVGAGMYCVYGETDHNGSGTMGLGIGVQGQTYQQGSGFITRAIAGYFEVCSGFYRASTGGINQNYGIWVKSGGLSGTLNSPDTTLFVDSPYTGATFTNGHVGLRIGDQSAGFGSPQYAIKVEGSTSYCDFGQNAITFNATNASISYKAVATLAIGNGSIGDVNGVLMLKEILMTGQSGAPTSAGTAGTAGEIIYFGSNLYFCSVTGIVGSATWNRVNLTAV